MSRQTPFNESHRILYGVEPIERSLYGAISVVQCQFCVHLGREKREGPVVKRQRTKNTQLFKFPFRAESYKNHLESQHTDDWKKYQLFDEEAKKKFFKEMDASGIRSYVETDRDLLRFTISQPAIVDVIIGDLFFLPEQYEVGGESEAITKTNAMKLFKLQEDGSYVITIKNPLRFNLAIEHVSVGLSFRQTAAVITQHRNACKNPKLAGLNDHMVGQFVRVLVAVAMQAMAKVINHPLVWAFSLAADASTHLGVPLLDQRIRVCLDGVLYNLHLLLVPFFERHTAINYVKLMTTLLDCMYSSWRDKTISISSDGENTMTGRHGGVVTLLEKECSNPVLRIWCVPHQLDIVVKNATKGVLDGAFYKIAHAFSVHLRTQQNLITEMGSKCPKDTTRWIAFGKMLKWKLQQRRRLMAYVADKRPVQAPSDLWWVITAAIAPLFDRIAITFATIQSPTLVISQQRQEMSNLMAELAAGLEMFPASDLNEVDQSTVVVRKDWVVPKASVVMHIHDQGSWVRELYNSLSGPEKQQTLQEIAIFALCIVSGGFQIQAERDSRNNARELEAPPVMPAQLVKMRPAMFIKEVLDPYRSHLEKHWSQEMIDNVENEHRELLAVYARKPNVKTALDKHDEKTFFNDAWNSLKGRFAHLRQFCGGLATAFPNTASVESDFSIVKWEHDSSRTSLTSLSLAGIMQAKQFDLLKKIMPKT